MATPALRTLHRHDPNSYRCPYLRMQMRQTYDLAPEETGPHARLPAKGRALSGRRQLGSGLRIKNPSEISESCPARRSSDMRSAPVFSNLYRVTPLPAIPSLGRGRFGPDSDIGTVHRSLLRRVGDDAQMLVLISMNSDVFFPTVGAGRRQTGTTSRPSGEGMRGVNRGRLGRPLDTFWL